RPGERAGGSGGCPVLHSRVRPMEGHEFPPASAARRRSLVRTPFRRNHRQPSIGRACLVESRRTGPPARCHQARERLRSALGERLRNSRIPTRNHYGLDLERTRLSTSGPAHTLRRSLKMRRSIRSVLVLLLGSAAAAAQVTVRSAVLEASGKIFLSFMAPL